METSHTPDFEIVHVPSVTELLAAREKLVGFSTVILELGEAPTGLPGDHSQRPVYQSAIGSIREAKSSGSAFEGLKALFASMLETVLGPYAYFDRGNFRSLEFCPGDEVPTGSVHDPEWLKARKMVPDWTMKPMSKGDDLDDEGN